MNRAERVEAVLRYLGVVADELDEVAAELRSAEKDLEDGEDVDVLRARLRLSAAGLMLVGSGLRRARADLDASR